MKTRRDALAGVAADRAANAGLWLEVYLREQTREERQQLINGASRTTGGTAAVYAAAFERWQRSLASDHVVATLRSQEWLAVGLGAKGVLENGVFLNHTFGVPFVPGSAIKGVCASYCRDVWAQSDGAFAASGEFYKQVFGSPDWSGALIFQDAWILPESVAKCLSKDVMTPHHQKYYSSEGPPPNPTGAYDPIPVNFLRARGKFLFAIGWRTPGHVGRSWAELGMKLCRAALADRGIGGKTRAGYGRLIG